tara:strand:- start:7464 stop:8906 length:1443 start_codon:yes stop_codon:yes gene_type:complete
MDMSVSLISAALLTILVLSPSSTLSQENWDVEANYEKLVQELDVLADEVEESDKDYWRAYRDLIEETKSAIDTADIQFAKSLLDQLRNFKRSMSTSRPSFPRDATRDSHLVLHRGLQQKLNESAQGYIDEINELCESLPDLVLNAESSKAIEPLLLDISSLSQAIEDHIGFDTFLDSRYRTKLNGAASYVRNYCEYLDGRRSNNGGVANNALKDALESSFGVQTMTYNQFESRKLPNYSFFEKILGDMLSIEDVDAAEFRFKEWKATAAGFPRYDVGDIEKCFLIFSLASRYKKMGEYELAYSHLNTSMPYSLSQEWPKIEELVESGRRSILNEMGRSLSELKQGDSELAVEYLHRIAEHEARAKNYSSVHRVITIIIRGRSPKELPAWTLSDFDGLKAYILAERFLDVGDKLMAMHYFSIAARTFEGTYTPVESAVFELKKLKESNPELFVYWNDAILVEMERLKSAIRPSSRVQSRYR